MREYGRKTEFLSRISPGFSRLGAAVFLAGFLLGMALIFIGQEGLVQNTSFLTSDSLEWIGTLEINRKGLMLYCLRQRLLPAVLLVLAAAAGAGGAAVCLFLLWSGFCAGTLLSVLALRYGIRGIMLFAGGILPQALLLVPAFWLLCGWCVSPGRNRKSFPSVRGRWNAASDFLCAALRMYTGRLCESFHPEQALFPVPPLSLRKGPEQKKSLP